VIWNDEDAARDPENYWTIKASKQQLYDFAVEKSKGLDSRLTEIIRVTDVEDMVKPPLVIRDLVLKDLGGMPNSRITLLGDAAHPMTPCESENPLAYATLCEGGANEYQSEVKAAPTP
jgi:2-polyprenyl-6-methoxyphenol hydroxylase-like FAD-dependent oxidoreductase